MFLRFRELSWLEERYRSGRAELVVIYGRRRLGKTTLVLEFLRDKKGAYLYTPRGPMGAILSSFFDGLRSQLGVKIFGSFRDFRDFLDLLTDISMSERIIVVIDEFQRISESDEEAVSILQDYWDRKLGNTKIFLIIVGSLVGMIEKIALRGDAPLFGRKTGKIRVSPLPFYRVVDFWSKLGAVGAVEAYGVFGGTPAYMDSYDFSKSLMDNVRDLIVSKNGRLNDEPEQILFEELRSPSIYLAVLRRIAEGRRGLPLSKIKVGDTNIVPYLRVLERMDIVERIHPVGNKRKTIYTFKDEFFRFWFRFIQPNYWLIEMELYDKVLNVIKENLNDYLSYTWEKVLRETIALASGKTIEGVKIPTLRNIGPYWDKETEIDVLGIAKDAIVVGEAKWENRKLTLRDISIAVAKAEEIAKKIRKKKYITIIASKEGFKQMYEEKNIILLTPREVINNIRTLFKNL